MKKPLLILSLLLSTTTFSSLSFGEWKLLLSVESQGDFYLDIDRIREIDGRFFVWIMGNPSRPVTGRRSEVQYFEADCKLMRVRPLSIAYYDREMAEGEPSSTKTLDATDWMYGPPNSSEEFLINSICDEV